MFPGPVHPHGCGAVGCPRSSVLAGPGSSPRVWGGSGLLTDAGYDERFIPTGVGRLQALHRRGPGRPVHPHGCGAVDVSPASSTPRSGSSPRVWGGLIPVSQVEAHPRFIPTGVGRFTRSLRARAQRTVHPHGCGAVDGRTSLPRWTDGSSPRVWGGSDAPAVVREARRFIPTGVGRFVLVGIDAFAPTVHPHGCGAVFLQSSSATGLHGSSPRVWGGSSKRQVIVHERRFIPTGVGRFPSGAEARGTRSVHPHGCGAVPGRDAARCASGGSSPRVWGGLNPESS